MYDLLKIAILQGVCLKCKEVNKLTNEKNAPKNPMTKKNNDLSSAQEVTYQDEFKRAENISNDEQNNLNRKNKK